MKVFEYFVINEKEKQLHNNYNNIILTYKMLRRSIIEARTSIKIDIQKYWLRFIY